MKIIIGSDHAGFELKTSLVKRLKAAGYEIEDVGTHNTESVDYPDFAAAVGRRVANQTDDLGILVCRTGLGMSIAANKIQGVRAAPVTSERLADLCREHNDANVLCLGADLVAAEQADSIVRRFVQARYEGGRHERRLRKVRDLEHE